MCTRAFPLLLLATALSAAEDWILRETFDRDAIPGVTGPTWVDDGLGGRALTGAGCWRPPAGPLRLDPATGTIEFRLCLLAPAAQADDWTIVRLRLPGEPADAFANGIHLIHGWGSGLFLLIGDRERRVATLRFPGTAGWRPGEWHHCAASWSIGGPGRCSLALWVDDRPVEVRERLTIDLDLAAWRTAAAAGRLELRAGSAWGRQAPGAIDDLRLYSYPRSYRTGP
jgi:hypothetical protein